MQAALGQVTPNSTTVALRATNNLSDPTARYVCEAIQFQALATNTGSVFICTAGTTTASQPSLTQSVHAEIPAPNASPATRPAWTVGNPTGMNPIDANEYWILPAVSGEGVRITALVT